MSRETKKELLAKYQHKPVTKFWQYDGFLVGENWDENTRPDADGDCILCGDTHELMSGGADIRVLIPPRVSTEDAVRLLGKITAIIQEHGVAVFSLCPRCGAHTQATHHPLCTYRDGTPTELSDDEVRRALEVLARADGNDDSGVF